MRPRTSRVTGVVYNSRGGPTQWSLVPGEEEADVVSTISWLDQSAEEQRRVRELVGLFSESESRDELGIGQVRDVFSNRLFPGTSVIQTRTRYFLFIPWLFQQHQAKKRSGADLLRRVQESERQLIATMLTADHKEGLIGREAGTQSNDGLNVKRSSVVCALLAQLPGVSVASSAPIELRYERPGRRS